MPRKKQTEPRSFSLREKKRSVLRAPMMSVRPDRKRICSKIVAQGQERYIRLSKG